VVEEEMDLPHPHLHQEVIHQMLAQIKLRILIVLIILLPKLDQHHQIRNKKL